MDIKSISPIKFHSSNLKFECEYNNNSTDSKNNENENNFSDSEIKNNIKSGFDFNKYFCTFEPSNLFNNLNEINKIELNKNENSFNFNKYLYSKEK